MTTNRSSNQGARHGCTSFQARPPPPQPGRGTTICRHPDRSARSRSSFAESAIIRRSGSDHAVSSTGKVTMPHPRSNTWFPCLAINRPRSPARFGKRKAACFATPRPTIARPSRVNEPLVVMTTTQSRSEYSQISPTVSSIPAPSRAGNQRPLHGW